MTNINSQIDESVDPAERALIDQLIAATRLYNTRTAVQELLNFTIRLREFAPFNAMLLHIQKPELTHAATARDWWTRFGRIPKTGIRPLLILRTMGPVDFVFDILDTEGRGGSCWRLRLSDSGKSRRMAVSPANRVSREREDRNR